MPQYGFSRRTFSSKHDIKASFEKLSSGDFAAPGFHRSSLEEVHLCYARKTLSENKHMQKCRYSPVSVNISQNSSTSTPYILTDRRYRLSFPSNTHFAGDFKPTKVVRESKKWSKSVAFFTISPGKPPSDSHRCHLCHSVEYLSLPKHDKLAVFSRSHAVNFSSLWPTEAVLSSFRRCSVSDPPILPRFSAGPLYVFSMWK